jgi:lipid-binding SYLF domain-containing protein
MRYMPIVAAVILAMSSSATAQLDDKVADRFWESTKILEEMVNAPDGGIPQEWLREAECAAVMPDVKRGAFLFGGRYGRGLMVCRDESGGWGAPSMTSIGGGGFGFQIGGQSTDVLMLFLKKDSIEKLLRDELTLGADASVAAGPKGRGVSAETTPTLGAEILTYSRSRGVFAGISLEGSVLKPDREANENLYGKKVEARELLIQSGEPVPEVARGFIEALTRVASR